MKDVGKLGIVGAILASSCCTIPLMLAFLGLGGIGLSRWLSAYHWWLQAAGALLLAVAWWIFLRERRRLKGLGAQIRHERLTTGLLTAATLVLLGFVGFSLSSGGVGGVPLSKSGPSSVALPGNLSAETAEPSETSLPTGAEAIVLQVRGMTCATCEIVIEQALNRTKGVIEADADAATGRVRVVYRSEEVDANQLLDVVRTKTPYEPMGYVKLDQPAS